MTRTIYYRGAEPLPEVYSEVKQLLDHSYQLVDAGVLAIAPRPYRQQDYHIAILRRAIGSDILEHFVYDEAYGGTVEEVHKKVATEFARPWFAMKLRDGVTWASVREEIIDDLAKPYLDSLSPRDRGFEKGRLGTFGHWKRRIGADRPWSLGVNNIRTNRMFVKANFGSVRYDSEFAYNGPVVHRRAFITKEFTR